MLHIVVEVTLRLLHQLGTSSQLRKILQTVPGRHRSRLLPTRYSKLRDLSRKVTQIHLGLQHFSIQIVWQLSSCVEHGP